VCAAICSVANYDQIIFCIRIYKSFTYDKSLITRNTNAIDLQLVSLLLV
jgi:hypothetical protein